MRCLNQELVSELVSIQTVNTEASIPATAVLLRHTDVTSNPSSVGQHLSRELFQTLAIIPLKRV